MKSLLNSVMQSRLFDGIAPDRVEEMLHCLHAVRSQYEKNSYVYNRGDGDKRVGLVLSGSVYTIHEDYFGNRSIVSRTGAGGLFGEAFASSNVKTLPTDIVASEPTDVLYLDYHRMLHACGKVCDCHGRLIENTVRILAERNLMLTRKIEHITQRTTRRKLLSYLSEQAVQCGTDSFRIPFNREQLADYLSVERSAMSAELSRMRRDGLIEYDRNRFTLLPGARKAF